MYTTNSEQFRFLHLTLCLGIPSALPFHLHPMGLQRPDGWMFTILQQLLPLIVLLRFHRPNLSKPTFSSLWRGIKIGLTLECILIGLLGWSILIGDLHIDMTFKVVKNGQKSKLVSKLN